MKLGKLKDFLVVECQYHDRSLSSYFEKEEGHIDSRAKRPKKEKWNIVRTQSEKDNWRFFGSATELSWKWVDFVIHDTAILANRFSEDDPVDGVMRQRLYQKIKRIGLEKVVTRLAIVVNREPYYSFNTIFDTEEEYQKGRKILLELKESLTKKFSVHQETLNQKGLEKTLSIFIPPSYTPENKRPVRKKLAQQNVIHEHEETENILKRRSAPLTD